MAQPIKRPPVYAVKSVDHALRLATALQLEGALTVSEAAARLGVARSTAHRLLGMLVYRDFAVQGEDLAYRAGPVLELAVHSQSQVSRLRAAALPHLARVVELVEESANLAVLVGRTVRFVASVESPQALRVGSREGMVFAAHQTTTGLLLLAEYDETEVDRLYATGAAADSVDLPALREELARVRKAGFAVNQDRSERGVTAVGVGVRDPVGEVVAGLSISMPSVRFDLVRLGAVLQLLRAAAQGVECDLAAAARGGEDAGRPTV
ncbi:MAG: transcriptional regulator [Nocardioides sp.]|nr:transcriptional regulator [Nocardioides sp.]